MIMAKARSRSKLSRFDVDSATDAPEDRLLSPSVSVALEDSSGIRSNLGSVRKLDERLPKTFSK